jgi:hypothetical protein
VHYADKITQAMLENFNIMYSETKLLSQLGDANNENPRLMQVTGWLAHADKLTRLLREGDVPLNQGFSQSA